jgi:hypothetical protein
MPAEVAIPLADAGPLASAIAAAGLLATAAYLIYRFGPALARLTGWCAWWVAWACGSQGNYGYCAALLLLGALAWGAGTIWYAKRRGHWPSPLSARLFARLLPRHAAALMAQPTRPTAAHVPRRHR